MERAEVQGEQLHLPQALRRFLTLGGGSQVRSRLHHGVLQRDGAERGQRLASSR